MDYRKITKESIEEALKEFGTGDHFIEKLTPEEVASLRHRLGSFVVDGLGPDIYSLPGGGYTGKGGIELFHQAMLKWIKDDGNLGTNE